MRVLFVTKHFWPRVGGVENQVLRLSEELLKRKFEVTVLTKKFDQNLKNKETYRGINIVRFSYPKIRFLGLFWVWLWFFKNVNLIKENDIVHFHSNLIWYWPFKLLFPFKKVYATFHGWEGIYPIPLKNILIRKVDSYMSSGTIAIHDYVEKYYGIKANIISYTAVDLPKKISQKKDKKRLVYVGRLDQDTGLPIILEALKLLKGFKIDFCGDGPLKQECAKYGSVHGFTDPRPLLEKAFICLSPGVTTILEAFSYKCLVATAFNNPLKKDYLLMTPFKDWIVAESNAKNLAEKIKYYSKNPKVASVKIQKAYEWSKTQNWKNEVERYSHLWDIR